MATSAPSFSSYDAKMDEMELKRAEAAATLQSAPAPVKPPLPPPTKTVFLEYTAPAGETYTAELVIRLLTHDELIRVGQIAASFAGTININALPNYIQDLCMAHATFQVMWGRKLPTWVKDMAMSDDNAIVQLYQVAVEHRQAYFRGDVRQGTPNARPGGLAIHTERPTDAAPEQNTPAPS
jgi:hypothetical protein